MNAPNVPDAQKVQQAVEASLAAFRHCYHASHARSEEAPDLCSVLLDSAELSLTLVRTLLRRATASAQLIRLCMASNHAAAVALGPFDKSDPLLHATYAVCMRASHACAELLGEEKPSTYDPQDRRLYESFPASDPPSTSS